MKLIKNDNIDCVITIYQKSLSIDGDSIPLMKNKKFKCSYSGDNSLQLSFNNIEKLAKGVVRINGDILKGKDNIYDGEIIIFGERHDIININKCRNLFDSRIVDFTELFIE